MGKASTQVWLLGLTEVTVLSVSDFYINYLDQSDNESVKSGDSNKSAPF